MTWTRTAVALAGLTLVLTGGAPTPATGQLERNRSPLPLDVAVSLHRHNHRSPVNLSPDGHWIAHTVETAETVPRTESLHYSDTGFPFAEGNARMQATLSSTVDDEAIVVGDPEAASWAPVWSPEGARVAFYSDEGGAAGLWIWTRSSGQRQRVADMVVRPFLGFETPRWAPRGDRLLVKALPAGRTLAEANAFAPVAAAEPEQADPAPDAPTVTVRRSAATEAARKTEETGAIGEGSSDDPLAATTRVWAADLALVDVSTGRVERLVQDTQVRSYDFSPDGRTVAYTVWTGWSVSRRQNLFELRLLDLATGDTMVLGKQLGLGSIGFGHEWSWAPGGGRLAYVTGAAVTVVSLWTGQPRSLEVELPAAAPAPPAWSADGKRLFVMVGRALWSLDPETGEARELSSIDGWALRNLVTPSFLQPTAWTRQGRLWVTATQLDGSGSGIFSLDPSRGTTQPHLRQDRSYGGAFSVAASDASGEIAFVASGPRELDDLWLLDTESGDVRRGSRINEALLSYELGTTRSIRFRSATTGEELGAALLLPPGHDSPARLPLVVNVYGGARGSATVNRFGLLGATPAHNLHVLATRGYAVLYPDAPLRTGRTIEDLVATVLPAVNAVIDAGWADPDHVAVMGESYGAHNVLSLLTRTDRFQAALISAAVQHPDLFAAYVANPGYFEAGQGDMGGTIWEFPDRYRSNSPLFDFPRIDTPLLVAQGELDGDLTESEAIFTALDRLGKHVEYRIYRGEDHVVTRPANVIDLWSRRLSFLAEHLDLEVGPEGRVRVR